MKYKHALPHPIKEETPMAADIYREPKIPTLMELSEIIYRETGCPHDYACEAARKIMERLTLAYANRPTNQGAGPAPTLVRVYRIGPDGVTSTLRGSAGLATAAQIKAMDEAAQGTGYRYTAVPPGLEPDAGAQ